MFLQVTEMCDMCDVYVEPVHKTTESIITESKHKSGNSVIYNLESFPILHSSLPLKIKMNTIIYKKNYN